MLVSLRWLKDYVDIRIPLGELVDRLTMAGLEVEEIKEIGPAFTNVVVAKLLSIKTHPETDKYYFCEVAAGEGTYSVVCGARNINLAGSSGMGLMDFDRLDQVYSYSLWYSYWLNDTSTLDINIAQNLGEFAVDVFDHKKPGREGTGKWSDLYGTVGARYQPAWDFLLDFGFGAGVGYEGWSVSSSDFSSRHGDGLLYYGLADVEYPVRRWLSIGAYAEPLFYPLNDRLETSVTFSNVAVGVDDKGKPIYQEKEKKEYDTLQNSVLVLGGVWIKIRIY